MGKEILFHETQKFRQWWLWAILLLVFGIIAIVAFQLMDGEKIENKTFPLISAGSSVIFILIPTVLFLLIMKLET